MKAALHLIVTMIAVVLATLNTKAQTLQEPTIDGTLDVIEGVDVNQDILWQVFVRPNDRKGDKVNLEMHLLNPALRDNFTLMYNSNRDAANEEEAVYSQITFNEQGVATVGPAGGEAMDAEYKEYFKINFMEPGVYAYKLVLRRADGNPLATVSESVMVGTVSGIDDMIGDTRVAVYPTVSEGMVRVNLGALRNATVSVVDLLGRKVMEQRSANGVVEINTINYARGTYLVKVLAGDEVASSRLIIK